MTAASVSQAASVNGFNDAFAPGNWTLSPATATFSADNSNLSLTTLGDVVDGDRVDYTILITTTGTISFDWLFTTQDPLGAFFERAGFLINGNFNELTDPNGGAPQNSSRSLGVFAGDTFGFSVWSLDEFDGPSTTRFSNFKFTDGFDRINVPEPATYALVALMLAGLAFSRRQQGR